jgi:cysteine synthase
MKLYILGLVLFAASSDAFVAPSPQRFASKLMKARGEGYGELLEDISQAVGNTPVVKINERLCPPGRTIYVKCEFFNPLSSVKDRLALSIIETAEKEGKLKAGDTVVEATSGNTGIAVAMMCAQRGYDCVICMAEPFSVERRKLMRMLGAKVIVTPKAGKGVGMVEKAAELAEANGWFLCHQFETEANWKIHESTTGPEILNDFKDKQLDYWVRRYRLVILFFASPLLFPFCILPLSPTIYVFDC